MFKGIIIALAALVTVTGSALAANIDFSSLGSNTYDITGSNTYTLGGITFGFRGTNSAGDFAQISSSGIYGTTGGLLAFWFNTPSDALTFNYSLLGINHPDPSNAETALINGVDSVGGVNSAGVFDPGSGNTVGTVAYNGAAFNIAATFFRPMSNDPSDPIPATYYFRIPNVTYNAVPEPISAALLLVGGSALAISRRARKK